MSARFDACSLIAVGSSGLSSSETIGGKGARASPSVLNARSVRSGSLSPRRIKLASAPGSAGRSNITSKRAPGPIGKALRTGSKAVSQGWPSTARTNGLAPSTASSMIRAFIALRMRSRTRDPGGSVSRTGTGCEFKVISEPGSDEESKLSKICALSSSRQSARTTSISLSASGGWISSTIRAPYRPRPSCSPSQGRA